MNKIFKKIVQTILAISLLVNLGVVVHAATYSQDTEYTGEITVSGYSFSYVWSWTLVTNSDGALRDTSTGADGIVSDNDSNQITLKAVSSRGSYYTILGSKVWRAFAQDAVLTCTITNTSGKAINFTYDANNITGDLANGTGNSKALKAGEQVAVTVTANTDAEVTTVAETNAYIKITAVEENGGKLTLGSSVFGKYSYQFGDEAATEALAGTGNAYSDTVASGTEVSLSEPTVTTSGYQFYGWMSGGSLLTRDTEYSMTMGEDPVNIYPVFLKSELVTMADSGTGPFLTGSANYHIFWKDAVASASNDGGNIILVENYTLPTTLEENGLNASVGSVGLSNGVPTYQVPAGITFVVPYSSENSTATNDTITDINSNNAGSAYKTLTVPSSCTIQVNGTVNVNAEVCIKGGGRFSGVVNGGYGKIILDGAMNIASGAHLYARGYIVASDHVSHSIDSSLGRIQVNSGATVHMPLQLMDWRGGNSVSAVKNNVFPLNAYYFQNIMVETVYESGASLYGQYAAYVLSTAVTGETCLVAKSGTAMFLNTTGNITTNYQYKDDRFVIQVNGDVQINEVSVELMGIYNVSTSGKDIPINGNISIYICNGSAVTIDEKLKLLPGAEITIEDGGTLTTSSNIYLYCEDDYIDTWRRESSDGVGRRRLNVSGLIEGAGQTILEDPAVVRVEGTLNVIGTGRIWESTKHPGGIVGLNGGTVYFQNLSASDAVPTVNEVVNAAESVTGYTGWTPVTALLAGYSTSADDYKPFSAPGAGTYHADGSWVSDTNAMWYQSKETVAASCTEEGYVLYNCTGGEGRKVSDGTSATGHSYGEWVLTTRPTSSTKGIETKTCSKCGDKQTREVIAVAQTTIADGTEMYCISLQEAIENTSDNFITMLADTTENTYTIDKAVTIDLNKFKVEVGGVASDVTVTGIDSGTNGFQSVPGTNLGSINVAAVAPEEAVNGKYYIAITDGSVTTFHRVAVAVTSCQFIYDKPNEKQYIVVQGTFKGTDQSVAELTDLGFKFTDTGSTTAGKSNLEVPSDKNYNGTEWSYYYGRDFDSPVTGKVTVQALMEFGQETTPFMSNPTEDLVELYKTFLGEI